MDNQRRLEQIAAASMEAECPEADELADFILGVLTGNDQLRVAAHTRWCPICQDVIAVAMPPEPFGKPLLARLLPLPLASGVRSGGAHEETRQYVAADLTVTLTFNLVGPGRWRLAGRVLRSSAARAGGIIVAQSGRRRRQTISDDEGFFGFDALPPGTYTLMVNDQNLQVQIADVLIGEQPMH